MAISAAYCTLMELRWMNLSEYFAWITGPGHFSGLRFDLHRNGTGAAWQ